MIGGKSAYKSGSAADAGVETLDLRDPDAVWELSTKSLNFNRFRFPAVVALGECKARSAVSTSGSNTSGFLLLCFRENLRDCW